MPEETPVWRNWLTEIKEKFERALRGIQEVARKTEKGEVKSVGDIYKRPSSEKVIELPIPKRRAKEKQAPLDIAESILEIWDAASELERLVEKVEHEAIRTLRLRRLVKLEIQQQKI